MSPEKTRSLIDRIPGGWKVLAVIGVAFVLGFLLRGGGSEPAQSGAEPASKAEAATLYTCSMHPRIRLENPKALCPICGMTLIPVTGGSNDDGPPRQLSMSKNAQALAEIETAPVERRMVIKDVRLFGMIDYDETRLRTITAWVPGRLDRLYVDYTGVAVKKGAPMAYMYSPELLVAQQALLKAEEAFEEMKASAADARNLKLQQGTVVALVDRLRLWGLSDDQIEVIRKRKTASDHMTILSPISGIVIHKNSVEGDYVKVGSKIYAIADLSRIWVYLDAYESDLSWIRYAQGVQFEAEAYPGEVFKGRISFIDPFLDKLTRTVKVRVTVDNVDGRLKPGMFVRARVHSILAGGGKIAEPFLAGKWISPVHPEVVTEGPGECPICGTPLVSAESLGYVDTNATAPLVIPVTAALLTGKRALVYVRVPDKDRPTFEGREVTLGARTRDHYIILDGLAEGERVVVKGNFKIDSALQILARPSMMSPPDGRSTSPKIEVPAGFISGLSPLIYAYLNVKNALTADDLDQSRAAAGAALNAVNAVEMGLLASPAHERWMELLSEIEAGASHGSKAPDLAGARIAFDQLSKAILAAVRTFGQATGSDLYEEFCPMAFDNRGASWLSATEKIENPYYGVDMLSCGEVRKTFTSSGRGPQIPMAFRRGLSPFFDAMLSIHEALAADDLAPARAAGGVAARALDGQEADPGAPWLEEIWGRLRSSGSTAADRIEQAQNLDQARVAFDRLSRIGISLIRRFGHAGQEDLREAFCPMAFDNQGAYWLQRGDQLRNPYLGAAMPGCGEFRKTYEATRVRAIPEEFRLQISGVVDAYLKIGKSLHEDEFEAARLGASALHDSLSGIDAGPLEPALREAWRGRAAALRDSAASMSRATTIEEVRRHFALVSDALAQALRQFGHAGPDDLVKAHCPMAFANRGANWVQRGEEIENPYFGAAMPRCGEVESELPTQPREE